MSARDIPKKRPRRRYWPYKKTGKRPTIFLANLGTAADFTARATFAKSFFEAGGIEAIDNEGFFVFAELAAAFKASGAPIACLCSSDKIYAGKAADAAKALQAAGAKHIYLAGRPSEQEAALRGAGVPRVARAGIRIQGRAHCPPAEPVPGCRAQRRRARRPRRLPSLHGR